MSGLLKQSHVLEELRLVDFERTQQLALSVEQEALSFPLKLTVNPRSEARPAQVWHGDRHWYQTLWLCFYPFLLWARDFSGVLAKTVVKHAHRKHLTRSNLKRWRWDVVRWTFFLILAPVLGLLSIVWNFCFYVFPGAVYHVMEGGASLVNSEGMVRNVNVQQALDEMQQGQQGVYSHAIAEYLCLVSSIAYTRSPTLYAQAEQIYRKLVAVKGQLLPTEPILQAYPSIKKQIMQVFSESEARMREYAAAIGLEATVMSELDSGLGGPVASLFVSHEHNVIIVGISGTNPFDFREILVDAAFAKVPAFHSYFSFLKETRPVARLHQGFYSSLFSLTKAQDYPAKRIKEAILAQAKLMFEKKHDTVKVFITGHSLGAATASILTSSLTTDEAEMQLCGAYLYGTPMNSDSAFVKAFEGSPSPHIWRIINDQDFVTRIPPSINVVASHGGVGDMSESAGLLDDTILDYSAIGHGIRYGRTRYLPDGLDQVKWECNVAAGGKVETVWWVWLFGHTPLRRFVQHSTISYSATLKSSRGILDAASL